MAGRLVEEYFRPAVVMELGESESRASCRSIPQFDITRALDQCADMLVRHGGHAQAAGFTVANQNIPALKEKLLELAQASLGEQELLPTLEIDADVNVNQLSEDLLRELEQLEPTGHMNPAPVLMSHSVYVKESRTVGADGKHLKLKLACAGKRDLDAIGFNLGAWARRLPSIIDIAYQLEMNEWNGSRSLQLNVQDIRPAEAVACAASVAAFASTVPKSERSDRRAAVQPIWGSRRLLAAGRGVRTGRGLGAYYF